MYVHRPIATKSYKSQISPHFTTFSKEFHLQSKASYLSMKSIKKNFSNHILNPTSFSWEKQVLEKSAFLDIFQKSSSIHKIKSNSIQTMFQ